MSNENVTPGHIDDELEAEPVYLTNTSKESMIKDELTKTSVYLTKKSRKAMEVASKATDDSLTDTINRALVVYAELVTLPVGGQVSWDHQDGERRSVRVVK